MRKYIKKVFKVIMMLVVAMADAAAPAASEFCKAVFYEEKKPEGISKLSERKPTNKKSSTF